MKSRRGKKRKLKGTRGAEWSFGLPRIKGTGASKSSMAELDIRGTKIP